jgi:hypothetical protein
VFKDVNENRRLSLFSWAVGYFLASQGLPLQGDVFAPVFLAAQGLSFFPLLWSHLHPAFLHASHFLFLVQVQELGQVLVLQQAGLLVPWCVAKAVPVAMAPAPRIAAIPVAMIFFLMKDTPYLFEVRPNVLA